VERAIFNPPVTPVRERGPRRGLFQKISDGCRYGPDALRCKVRPGPRQRGTVVKKPMSKTRDRRGQGRLGAEGAEEVKIPDGVWAGWTLKDLYERLDKAGDPALLLPYWAAPGRGVGKGQATIRVAIEESLLAPKRYRKVVRMAKHGHPHERPNA